MRLNRRIADVQRSIEGASLDNREAWGTSEREKMLALLNATLRSLEARKAVLERTQS